jgi:predicted RNA-binding Zn-ribbon protein involved in translation (DUF1610 family)
MKLKRPDWHDLLLRGIAILLLLDVLILSAMSAYSFVVNNGRFFLSDMFTALAVIGLYLAPALVAAGLIRRGCSPRLMEVAIALMLMAMGISLVVLIDDRVPWSVSRLRSAFAHTAATLSVVMMLIGGLGLYASRAHSVRWARAVAVMLAVITAGLVLAQTWFELVSDWRQGVRAYEDIILLGAVSGVVLTLLAILAVRALHRREQRRHGRIDASLPKRVTLTMNCPRCGEALIAPTGDYRCPVCRFAMEIIIEEPRCACGYLIYEQTSAQCPECGREIPEGDRWREAMNG